MPLPKEPIGPTVVGPRWSAHLTDEPAIDAEADDTPAISAEADNGGAQD